MLIYFALTAQLNMISEFLPFSAASVSLRTSMRNRGLSGINGNTMQHSRAGKAFSSSRMGHNVSVPT